MEFTLKDILTILLKKIWIILLVSVLCMALFFSFSNFLMSPSYTTTAKMLVNQKETGNNASANLNQINYNERIVGTYVEILQTNNFLEKVSEKINQTYTSSELRSMISISAVNSTQIFQISVRNTNPSHAFTIANAIVELVPEHIMNIYPADSVGVVESPVLPSSPSSPNVKLYTILGFFVGFLITFIIIILMELLDTRLKSEEDLTNNFEIPILGSIPKMVISKKEG